MSLLNVAQKAARLFCEVATFSMLGAREADQLRGQQIGRVQRFGRTDFGELPHRYLVTAQRSRWMRGRITSALRLIGKTDWIRL